MNNYDDLKYENQRLKTRVNKLLDENNLLHGKLNSANFQIETELLPRIEHEKQRYDAWALGGGGDACTKNGIAGNCGIDCPAFGSNEDCP